MTNEELIKRFLTGRTKGGEWSYGFYSAPNFKKRVGSFFLFTNESGVPIAIKEPENRCVVITPSDAKARSAQRNYHAQRPHWKTHVELVIKLAAQLNIDFVLSPDANKARFQKYMESKITNNLDNLAQDLRTGMCKSICRDTENDSFKPKYTAHINEPAACYAVPNNYKKLMENIHTLLEGEIRLRLPKNQISLVDTDETQSLWRWLIKDNPNKKDREILTKMYTLSQLMVKREPVTADSNFWIPAPGAKYHCRFIRG